MSLVHVIVTLVMTTVLELYNFHICTYDQFGLMLEGLASYDEMCDVYIMYWVDGDHTNLLQVIIVRGFMFSL